jgi:ABC-type antimicrobial peptide transport system permease subunit
MHSENTTSKQLNLRKASILFLGGAIAGAVVFTIIGVLQQWAFHVGLPSPFPGVLIGFSVVCGLLAVGFRRNFCEILNDLLQTMP